MSISTQHNIVPIPRLKQTLPPNSPLKTPDQWIFTHDEIEMHYSYGDTPEEHIKVKDKREKGITFLQQLGHRLLLPQTTIAAAATFFHRFYMRNNFSKFHHFDIAATCLFVACKTEETIQKIGRLSETCALVAMKGKLTETTEIEKEATRWKKIILTQEPWVCEAITFDFYLEQPLRPLLQYITSASSTHVHKHLLQFSICFLTDSLRTTLVLQYQPTLIAAACLYLACLHTKETFPDTWMTALNVSKYMMLDAAFQILEVYDTIPTASMSISSSSPSIKKGGTPGNTPAGGSEKKVRLTLEEFKQKRKLEEEETQQPHTGNGVSSS